MRRAAAVLVPVPVLLAGAVLGPASSGTPDSPQARPQTIVEVSGAAAHGFRVERLDGSVRFTPTWSETRAECEEYRRRVDRVRCKARERARFWGLAAVRDALRHARS